MKTVVQSFLFAGEEEFREGEQKEDRRAPRISFCWRTRYWRKVMRALPKS
jgi:hypothetical protein